MNILIKQINEPFPLRNNTAIQWIELDDPNARFDNCYISFQNQTV